MMKMREISNKILTALPVLAATMVATPAFAQEAAAKGGLNNLGAAIGIGIAALGGALGQGKAISAMLESYGRNPSVGGKLLTPMLIGLAFVESLVILAFVIAYKSL